MKTLLSALLAGPAVGLLMYVGLQAADPVIAKDEPWLLHFRESGFETHLYSVSASPKDRVPVTEWRPKLEDPRYAGSRLLTLDVGFLQVQVLEVPSEDLARELFTARKTQHLHTIALEKRCFCIVRPLGNGDRAAQDETDKVVKAFRELAKQR